MRAFWLVQNYVISRYNHLARGDYSRALNFEMAASRFVNVTEEEINMIKENSVPSLTFRIEVAAIGFLLDIYFNPV